MTDSFIKEIPNYYFSKIECDIKWKAQILYLVSLGNNIIKLS